MAANGAFGDTPATVKPSGMRVMRSPWLIQTVWLSPGRHTPSNSGLVLTTETSARPNSRW